MTLAQTIKNNLVGGGVALIALGTVSIAQPSHAVVVNFENDTAEYKGNGFVSTGSPLVSFSDSDGNDLYLTNFWHQSIGKGLAVFSEDSSGLMLNFSSSVNFLSLVFGNDDSRFTANGDLARLEIFDGSTLLNTVDLALNRDDIANQTITFSGSLFNRAKFTYVNSSGTAIDLTEIVDDVKFTPVQSVPEPSSMLGLLAMSGLGGSSLLKRKRKQANPSNQPSVKS